MRLLRIALAPLVICGVLCCQAALDNETILKLVKAGIGEDVIINMVNQQPGKYAVSADDVIALKKAGVSDKVVAAMVIKNGATSMQSAASGTPSGTAQRKWKDRAEFDLFNVLAKEPDQNKKLSLLNTWKEKYPTSDFSLQRQEFYCQTYAAMNQPQKVMEACNETVQIDPKDLTALFLMAQNVLALNKPEDLALGEKAANELLTNLDTFFDPGKKPATPTDAQWAQAKTQTETLAHTALGWIAQQKKDSETAEKEFTQSLKLTPNNAQVSYWLGTAILAEQKPERQAEALYHFARAASLDQSQGGFNPQARQSIDAYFVDAYNRFRGQDAQGLQQLRELAKAQPLPPEGFTIKNINQVNAPILGQQPAGAFKFKVLQSESVPYVVQTGGGISTNCNIFGSTNTSFSATTMGNSTFGNATTTPNLSMNCSSSDNTLRWTHVLNAMLVEASDGNAYIIACDRAWRWSKCSALRPGDVFNARQTDKGFVVQFFNSKSEEKEATYSVLQAKSLR